MTIDVDAPVKAEGSIEIDADVDRVWGIMAEIDAWPSWNPDVKWAHLAGPLEVGSGFKWKAGPGTIRSTLQHVEPPSLIVWTGVTLGIHAVHVWRIESIGSRTRVSTEESWSGLLARMFKGSMTRTLGTSIQRGLEALRDAAEGASV